MPATDYAQVLAADMAANDVGAVTATASGLAALRLNCGVMQDLGCMSGAGIYAANAMSQGLWR